MKHILIAILFSSCSVLFTMDKTVQLSAKTICEDLNDMFLHNFVQKTNVHIAISARPLRPEGVVVAVDTKIVEFNKAVKNEDMAQSLNKLRPLIIKKILKDYPEEIARLEADGWLKP